MLSYWLLFAFFALGALVSPLNPVAAGLGHSVAEPQKTPFRFFFILGVVGMILLIGLRYKVGGDWVTYLNLFHMSARSLTSAFRVVDPGYGLVNYMAAQAGSGIWLVNLVCGAIFAWGLFRLCVLQPSPWLAMTTAIPYMVIVVAMGYTRQGVALGFLMAGLARQIRGANIISFAAYVFAASLFHKSAVLAFPLVAISARGNRIVNFLILAFASYGLYQFFLNDALDGYVKNYIEAQYASQGAAIRVAMSALAAVLFFAFRQRLEFSPIEYRIWRNFSIAALGAAVMLWFASSSTAVDRVSIYLMPLQVAVIARAALLGGSRLIGTAAVLTYAFTVEFVWLNFAQFASKWIPYQFVPF